MKSAFYYLYGVITTIQIFAMLFTAYAPIYLDDYWVDYLYLDHEKDLRYCNLIIAIIMFIFTIIWVYCQGQSANHEKKEPLLITKDGQTDIDQEKEKENE